MLQRTFAFLLGKISDPTRSAKVIPSPESAVIAWKHGITVRIVRPLRARRYLLRMQSDGSARLAIPRRGSRAEAIRFLERSEAWLVKRYRQWQGQAELRQPWRGGASFLYRGEKVVLRTLLKENRTEISFADHVLLPAVVSDDYRPVVHAYLRVLAEKELPPRTLELAKEHDLQVRRITVRAQKTRWGSCSARGTISLNWRLIQAPPFVVDYLIVHELMHLRQMNHSARFWKLVATAFPRYREAEMWLKATRLEALV